MKKNLILTLAGLIIGGLAMIFGYLFLESINTGMNIIFMLISPILFTISIICFFIATKQKKVDLNIDQNVIEQNTTNIIQNNNNKFAEWENANSQKDKLKILRMSGQIEEQK